jgi:ribosome-associated heat shock protein Hsp15
MSDGEDRAWQRLDKFLWHARIMRQRADCARLAEGGLLRINRQATDKPHAKVRIGDVITVPLPGSGGVRVIEVVAFSERRGPANTAQTLYRVIPEGG